MDADWDLHAVVRGCTAVNSSSTTVTPAAPASVFGNGQYFPPCSTYYAIFPEEEPPSPVLPLSNSNPFEAKGSFEGLQELCKPFFVKSEPPPFSFSPKSPPPALQQPQQPIKRPLLASSATSPRSKRRKNQFKKVCQVSAENLSSDVWAWRKYGQKPIKGSPYPRGYYRCSTSKGCLARKQVERNKSDPAMFIVTYTGEHNHPAPTHRNSLAGSTRQKSLTAETATAGDFGVKFLSTKPVSPVTPAAEEGFPVTALSGSTEDLEDLLHDDEGEEHGFGISDMVVTDDFFEGLDELTGSTVAANGGDCFGDPFVGGGVALPSWGASNAATAGGGR